MYTFFFNFANIKCCANFAQSLSVLNWARLLGVAPPFLNASLVETPKCLVHFKRNSHCANTEETQVGSLTIQTDL